MLSSVRADRLWVAGGALGVVLLLLLTWFFLISPQNAQTAALEEQAAAADVRVASLQRRLTQLQTENADLPRYKAELTRDRQALPRTPALADFLRELQNAGTAAGVTVSGMTAGAPAPVTGKAAYAIPVTVTASGAGDKLERFVDQLQRVQPRAALVSAVTATADGKTGSIVGSASLNITLQIFTTLQGEKPTR